MVSRRTRQFRSIVGLVVLMLGLVAALPVIAQADGNPPPGSYIYIVKPGDTWNLVAQRTGVSASELIRANPQAVRRNGWLWIGDRLTIPAKPLATGYWYQVRPGDTWNIVAKATGVSVRQLWRANPGLLDWRLWLYIGQRVWIPAAPPLGAAEAAAATPAATAPAASSALIATVTLTSTVMLPPTATPTPTVTPVPTATLVPTVAVTSTLAMSPTVAAPTQAAQTAATPEPGSATALPALPAATPNVAAGCPTTFAGYPDAILAYLNKAGHKPADLQVWLVTCGALVSGQGGVTQAALQSSKSADVLVTIKDPASQLPDIQGMVIAYFAGPRGYTLAHAFQGAGMPVLLKSGDINADGKNDLVWTDTTCGAYTCFSALAVQSWDGTAYQDWIAGEPAMAGADYTFRAAAPEGTGEAIIVHGGVISDTAAGPQRGLTEIYLSIKGAPYTLVKQVYDKSSCLYHAILDANTAFNGWAQSGFDAAITAYRAALSDPSLTACTTMKDEVAVLRDFAQYRLVVAYVANGQATQANTVATKIVQPALQGAAKTFLDSYKASGSIIQACRDMTTYAKAHPDSWKFLADWGYGNPSFTEEELCPLQ